MEGDVLDKNGAQKTENVELWPCNPVECIRELFRNPVFKSSNRYTPKKLYSDQEGTERIYDEMWTADWWWDTQVCTVSVALKIRSINLPLLGCSSFGGHRVSCYPVFR